MSNPTARRVVCGLAVVALACPSIAAVRIGGELHGKGTYAVVRTEKNDPDSTAIVAFDRSAAACLDRVRSTPERMRTVGGPYCRKLAILPGERTIEAKVLDPDTNGAGGRVGSGREVPMNESTPITFTFEAGKTYRLDGALDGELSIRCKRRGGGFPKWIACPE